VRGQADEQEVQARDAKLEALAEFAAGAGHELNNPLAVVVGRAQLLLGRATDSETARSLQIILAQGQRAHRILRDLMFIARPPALRPRACRPAEILRASLTTFQEECESRQIRLTGEIDAGEAQSWSDPEALGHLADILLRNAIQATPPGGRIQVRSSRLGNELKWWFSDNGKGIGPAEGAHLFDPFFCGRQAGRGLGLGLPRAGRIVSLAGGSLRWSSELGQGTTFQVCLPLANPPDQVKPEASFARESPDFAAGSPKNQAL
jgi:signal transduction histidine kinase